MRLRNISWIRKTLKFKHLNLQRTTPAWSNLSLLPCFRCQIRKDRWKRSRLSCFRCSQIGFSNTTNLSGSLRSRSASLATNLYSSKVAQFMSSLLNQWLINSLWIKIKQKKLWASFLKTLPALTIVLTEEVTRKDQLRNLKWMRI